MTRHNRLHEITIKKTVILLIVTLIFCLNTAKTGLLESYDQEICDFIDRNAGRDVNVSSREVHEVSCEGGRDMFRVETERLQTDNRQRTHNL